MPSSTELWILNKIPEIAQRCGVKLADAEIFFEWIKPGNHETCYYRMSALGNVDFEVLPKEYGQKIQKMWSLLGLDEDGYRRFGDISEAVEAVEQALKLAPRARTRE